ncbi:MAG: hypothetical protein JW889_03340 [Verrucomicrobia bacterium]|nr:hypothetical protein [Verrucomicrobiota bacterium]
MDGIDAMLAAFATGEHLSPARAVRVRRHVYGQLLCLGRHTLTGLIATTDRLFDDWTADYRLYSAGRIAPERLFEPVRRAVAKRLEPGAPLVVALDDTHIKKTGAKIPGAAYRRDPLGPPFHLNLIRAQRFVQLSLALPIGTQTGRGAKTGPVRMVPVDFVHAPTPKKPTKNAAPRQWTEYRQAQRRQRLGIVAAQRLGRLRKALDHDGRRAPICAVGDGGYTNGTLLKHLPERTVFIGRIRGDAHLAWLPDEQPTRGRRRLYGPAAPTPEQVRADASRPWQTVSAWAAGKTHSFRVKTLAPLRWRAAGATHDLRLLVIAPLGYRLSAGSKLLYRRPAYLLCSDVQLDLTRVLQSYLWRSDIEVNFRDEKTVLGCGQAQVRHPDSAASVPTLSVAAYALLLAAAERGGLPNHGLPPPKWRRRPPGRTSTQVLLSRLRAEAWGLSLHFPHFASRPSGTPKPPKLQTTLASAVLYGAQRA